MESLANVTCTKCLKPFRVKPYRTTTAKFCSWECSGRATLKDRFWSKVERGADSECWLWKASLTSTGYGQIYYKGRPFKAHRIAFKLEYGILPKKLGVLHRCDTPKCCNPKHLFLGTQAVNVADMFSKGRNGTPNPPRGEKSPNAKLNTEAIRSIRSSSESNKLLATRFGVSDTAILYVRNGRNWKYIS